MMRVNVAEKVAKFKKKMSNKVTYKTNRSKVTNFIASNHSRQEFPPLIGKLSDKAMVEPLHLKNNAVQHLHAMFLKQVLSISSLPSCLNISELPHTSPMSKYLVAMECQVKASRLKKQFLNWLIDDRTRNKYFTYRFTGKDSKLFLHGFMYLLDAIKGDSNDLKLLAKLLFLAFVALKLRDCVAYFSAYNMNEENLQKLSSLSCDYFTALVLFGIDTVSPTVWSIAHIAPVHAKCVYEKYGVGLGINTMQGREAKHVQIAAYAKNSPYKQRWFQVFRHDYISKVWLPSHQPSLFAYQLISALSICQSKRKIRLLN